MKHVTSLFLACLLGAPVAVAQPADAEKGDAKALLQSGLKLFAAQDYLGALAVFRNAYERFPSPKILLNIGTTLLKLGRKADAANAYQRYLDTAQGDTSKREEVARALAELDRELGIVEVDVTPEDSEIKVGSGEWLRASVAKRARVVPGTVTVNARRGAYRPNARTLEISASQTRKVAIVLVSEDGVAATPIVTAPVDDGIRAQSEPTVWSQLGVVLAAHIDPVHKGGAARVGATFELTDRVQAQAAAIVGPSFGAYLGGRFAILPGNLRPLVSAGLPVFFSDGPRVAVRGAGGVEVILTRNIALLAELGVEHVFNPEPGVSATLFVPAIGALGRL